MKPVKVERTETEIIETYEFPNGRNICHHPILTDEERKRREDAICEAMARFAIKAIEAGKMKI